MKSEIGTVGQYSGAAATFVFGLTLNEWGMIVGMAVGIIGFAYNVWVKERLIKIAKSKGVNIGEE